MPANSERPFGHHTLKLHAAFVPDDAEELSRADIVAAVGSRPLKLPAVLVAKGEPPPGHPYINAGEFEFRPDAADDTGQSAAGAQTQQSSGQGPDASN